MLVGTNVKHRIELRHAECLTVLSLKLRICSFILRYKPAGYDYEEGFLRISANQFIEPFIAGTVPREVYKLRLRYVGRSIAPKKLHRILQASFREPGTFFDLFRRGLRERFFLSDLNRKEFYINLMTSLGDFDSILDDADMVHENKFQALGSPVYSFGKKIDWHLDFKTGRRWKPQFYSKVKKNTLDDPSDMRVPWAVNRLHQAIWLGKAYWTSHSEAHTEKFMELVRDWIEKNPAGFGINWYSASEVAIRAMNLIVGLLYFIASTKIDEQFLFLLICSLYEHGVYIRRNLFGKRRDGSQRIAGLVGLVYLGMFFYDIEAGREWVRYARTELDREIVRHVRRDGTVYDRSMGYHRMVTEMFTTAYVLLKLNRFSLSDEFARRLEKMFSFLAHATMRNGTVPNIGNADDGRMFRMKSKLNFNDHRDLLAVGAALFGGSELRQAAGGFSELALLLLGGEGFERFSQISDKEEISSAVYREAGFAFLKTEKDFASFNFGWTETKDRMGRGHNDMLSFTIAGKNQFIVDRGTYSCNPDAMIRDRLRSTCSHNTIVIDRTEQAGISGARSMTNDPARPELLNWNSTEEQDIVEAQHHAYERIARSVTHRRSITFNKRQRAFRVEDELLGEGTHSVEIMFHFAPGLRVEELGRNFLALEGEEFALMKFQNRFTLENWDHSPSCGVLQKARTAHVRLEIDLPKRIETYIFITSSEDEMNYLLNRIQSLGSTE